MKRMIIAIIIFLTIAAPVSAQYEIFLPIINKTNIPPSSDLWTGQVVVQVDQLVVVKNIITASNVYEWSGRYYWSKSIQVVAAYYLDDLWPPTTFRYDAPLDWTPNSVGMYQASFVPDSVTDGKVSELILLPKVPGTLLVSHVLQVQGETLFAYRPLYVMACVADFNDDGVRDIVDIMIVVAADGSQVGDPNYSVWLDMNGDGIIDINDVYIARHYINVPCPGR